MSLKTDNIIACRRGNLPIPQLCPGKSRRFPSLAWVFYLFLIPNFSVRKILRPDAVIEGLQSWFWKDSIPVVVGRSKILKAHQLFSAVSSHNKSYPDTPYWLMWKPWRRDYWRKPIWIWPVWFLSWFNDEDWPIRTAQYQRPAAQSQLQLRKNRIRARRWTRWCRRGLYCFRFNGWTIPFY